MISAAFRSIACSAETDIYWCVRSNLNHHQNHCWPQSYQSLSRQIDAKLSTLSLFRYFPMKPWQETPQQRWELCHSPASVPINQWFSNWRAADQAGQLRLKKHLQRASSCRQSSKPSTAPAADLCPLLPGDWRGQHNGNQTEWLGKSLSGTFSLISVSGFPGLHWNPGITKINQPMRFFRELQWHTRIMGGRRPHTGTISEAPCDILRIYGVWVRRRWTWSIGSSVGHPMIRGSVPHVLMLIYSYKTWTNGVPSDLDSNYSMYLLKSCGPKLSQYSACWSHQPLSMSVLHGRWRRALWGLLHTLLQRVSSLYHSSTAVCALHLTFTCVWGCGWPITGCLVGSSPPSYG